VDGLTWDQVASALDAGAGSSRITCFRAMAGTERATFDFAGQQQQACVG
jgi:hypothetical protein